MEYHDIRQPAYAGRVNKKRENESSPQWTWILHTDRIESTYIGVAKNKFSFIDTYISSIHIIYV